MSKRKAECTPEEWAAYRKKERARKAKASNKARMREYEKRPDVIAKRKAYEKKRAGTPERRAYTRELNARPHIREKRLLYIKTYNAAPETKAYRRDYNLRHLYGLDFTQVEALIKTQKGCCAVCRRQFNAVVKGTKPHVDHDHLTGAVRGLLCGPCNSIEGLVANLGLTPAQFAERLTAYLANPPAREVLHATR